MHDRTKDPDFWQPEAEAAFHQLLALSRTLFDSWAGVDAAFLALEAAATLPTRRAVALALIEPVVRERLQQADAGYAAGAAPPFESAINYGPEDYRRFMQQIVEQVAMDEAEATEREAGRGTSQNWDQRWAAILAARADYRAQHPRWHEGPPTAAQVARAEAEQAAFEARQATKERPVATA